MRMSTCENCGAQFIRAVAEDQFNTWFGYKYNYTKCCAGEKLCGDCAIQQVENFFTLHDANGGGPVFDPFE